MQPSSSRDRSFGIALLVITAVAAALRLRHLGEQILGDDELHLLVVVTSRTLRQIPGTVIGYDYGIPLALLDRAWSSVTPLTEWMLRAPMLVCGIATPALAAGLARRFASRSVALLVALVVAVHPLFIFYSRTVRPYGVCLALVLGAWLLLERWQDGRRVGALAGAIVLSALGCWCQPLAGITVALMFVAAGLVELRPGGRPLALCGAAAVALGLTLLLFAPALEGVYRQFVVGKTGLGTLSIRDVARDAAVFTGMPGLVPALLFGLLALAGGVRLARSTGRRALLLLLPAAVQPAVIVLLRPQGIFQSLVLARYQLYVLPVFVLCACLAIAALAGTAARRVEGGALTSGAAWWSPSRASGRCAGLAIAALFAAAWLVLGPYAAIYTDRNAYSHHDLFQTFQYRDDPAWLASHARSPGAPVHPFYAALAAEDVPLVLEWPPPMDYPRNYLPYAQAVHGRPMKLLVRPPESPVPEPWWSDGRLALRNVVVARPETLAALSRGTAIVVHRNPPVEAGHFLAHIDGWVAPLPEQSRACAEILATLTAACGPPVRDDRYVAVFRAPGP
jgi:Dolichyl-phosphate-mannose-protein mannosyltransferase